jgi:alkanesulfonate monooxygenase SsuD/methylene tetrahydromethanopterin reductase-like flavin-dependent oxidoreductase (luciferase family)
MANPREYALPGNQDPATPWPSSLVLLSAIAAVTTRIRLVAGAVIAPLRHPLLLARELGSLDLLSGGRLVVQPTVSWLAEEYAALGVPFRQRGDLLDEHLAAWRVLWRDTPASFSGEHYCFRDVYFEPKAHRPGGPVLWLGGASLHRRMLARLVAYGDGFNPLGRPGPAELTVLAAAMRAAGRDPGTLELVGGTRAAWPAWARRWRRYRRRRRPGSAPSASSRHSSPTTRRRSGRCAGKSSAGWTGCCPRGGVGGDQPRSPAKARQAETSPDRGWSRQPLWLLCRACPWRV